MCVWQLLYLNSYCTLLMRCVVVIIHIHCIYRYHIMLDIGVCSFGRHRYLFHLLWLRLFWASRTFVHIPEIRTIVSLVMLAFGNTYFWTKVLFLCSIVVNDWLIIFTRDKFIWLLNQFCCAESNVKARLIVLCL